MTRPVQSEIVRELRERLKQMECSNRLQEDVLSTGVDAFDQLFPRGGLPVGTLIEWLSEGEGIGSAMLSLAVGVKLLEKGGALVVLDGHGEFYPPAAAHLGIPLERTLVVQPRNEREVLWTAEQALRSPGVALLWVRAKNLNERAYRRLQLAAEIGGGLGFLLRPVAQQHQPSWAWARLFVKAVRDEEVQPSIARWWRIELLHCRGGPAGKMVEVGLSDETDHVHLVSRLAHSTSADCAAKEA